MIGVFSGLGTEVPRNAGKPPPRSAVLVREAGPIGGPRLSGLLLALDLPTSRPRWPPRAGRSRRWLRPRRDRDHRAGLDGGDLRPRPTRGRGALHQLPVPHAHGRRPARPTRTPGSRPSTSAISASAPRLPSRPTNPHPAARGPALRLLIDTEGAGRFRPASAALAEFGPVGTTMAARFASDGTQNAPQGSRGGLPGGRAAQYRRGAMGALTLVLAFGGVTLGPGETLVASAAGAAATAPRPSATRSGSGTTPGRLDLAERAREVYGLVHHPTGAIDPPATSPPRAGLAVLSIRVPIDSEPAPEESFGELASGPWRTGCDRVARARAR